MACKEVGSMRSQPPTSISTRSVLAAKPGQRKPWSVDRWGRLLAGSAILACTTLGILNHPVWLSGVLVASINLVVTSLTDRCFLHDMLIHLGAKEREDLFLPGGDVRT